MMRNFGFENGVHWPTRSPSFKIYLFEWKWILIGLRGFIDRFWQHNFAPKSRYGVQTRLWALLKPAIRMFRLQQQNTVEEEANTGT